MRLFGREKSLKRLGFILILDLRWCRFFNCQALVGSHFDVVVVWIFFFDTCSGMNGFLIFPYLYNLLLILREIYRYKVGMPRPESST